MEVLYRKEKEEADLLLEQQRLVGGRPEPSVRKRAACSYPSRSTDEHSPKWLPQLSLTPYAVLSFS